MAIPAPEPGLVIRYDYLWSHESATGQDQGKERPACLVAASDQTVQPRYVVILPITHTRPSGDTSGVEIPPRVRQALGLDDATCWVIVSEYNVDEWPNGGLAAIPGRPGEFGYGFLPPRLFVSIKESFLALSGERRSHGVRR